MKMKTDNKKRFENPELKIILFTNEDIITDSGDFGDGPGAHGDDWTNGFH